jgi:SAM-dependent methyltransferase
VGSLPPEFFRRQDERPDALFFAEARLGIHFDPAAATILAGWYDELLPRSGTILDLCAGASSHLPDGPIVIGAGAYATGMDDNPRLRERWPLDLNRDPGLPWADASFAAAVCTSGVQYLVHPREVFREVRRCLAPGAPLLVAFGNRMFPTKAVLCWRVSDDAAHARLVASYLAAAGFEPAFQRSFTPDGGDPLYLVGAFASAG